MGMRPHPKYASADPHRGAWSTCDGCGFIWNHPNLNWQREWAGFNIINKRTLVCPRCLDVPNETLRALVLPPDPDPVIFARPEQYAVDEGLLATFTAPGAPVASGAPGGILTVTAIGSGEVSTGAQLAGAGVAAGTVIGDQLSGPNPPGGVGTYAVSPSQTVASTTLTASAGF
jgi:hypothetical protein